MWEVQVWEVEITRKTRQAGMAWACKVRRSLRNRIVARATYPQRRLADQSYPLAWKSISWTLALVKTKFGISGTKCKVERVVGWWSKDFEAVYTSKRSRTRGGFVAGTFPLRDTKSFESQRHVWGDQSHDLSVEERQATKHERLSDQTSIWLN